MHFLLFTLVMTLSSLAQAQSIVGSFYSPAEEPGSAENDSGESTDFEEGSAGAHESLWLFKKNGVAESHANMDGRRHTEMGKYKVQGRRLVITDVSVIHRCAGVETTPQEEYFVRLKSEGLAFYDSAEDARKDVEPYVHRKATDDEIQKVLNLPPCDDPADSESETQSDSEDE